MGKHTLSTVDLTLHSSFFIRHILISFIVFVSLCPQTEIPLSLSEHPSASASCPPSLSLTFGSLSCPCSPSTFLPPSFFPCLSPPPPPLSSSSSRCALDSLSFPLAHTLRQHPPISTYFPLTSPLLSPPSSLSPTDTYHLWHLPVYCLPPFSPPFLPPSLYSLTHSTLLPRANSYMHTLMLIGTQGQSTLFPVLVTRLLDTELS